ncbi:hypothetical protein MSAN_00779300 [Mycena sanguinolenta]|uniref:Uncharacterized protein n=1 Tax=Mycena sanguinolenta TaxID=230812 RepID=A0A8H7DEH5_9AGAR|nr:hypothetical protein MSAN_00779300 [Mycena sanguinolenta]
MPPPRARSLRAPVPAAVCDLAHQLLRRPRTTSALMNARVVALLESAAVVGVEHGSGLAARAAPHPHIPPRPAPHLLAFATTNGDYSLHPAHSPSPCGHVVSRGEARVGSSSMHGARFVRSAEGRDEMTEVVQTSRAQCTCSGGARSGGGEKACANAQVIHANRSDLRRVVIIIRTPVVRDHLTPPAENTRRVIDPSACGKCSSAPYLPSVPHPCARLRRRSEADDDNLVPIPDLSTGSLMGRMHGHGRNRLVLTGSCIVARCDAVVCVVWNNC